MSRVKVNFTTKFDKLPEVSAAVETLGGRKVKVGALKGENAWLAGIHEYGCKIRAKKAKFLTVPVCSEAAGKKASSFSDLFVCTSKKGLKFLARNENGNLKLYYWLTPSVTIPERSFLRSGHDANAEKIMKKCEKALGVVIDGKMSIDTWLDMYGQMLSTAIKTYMRDLSSPPNSRITKRNKGSSNPLVDTGGLVESITWEREK